MTERLANEGPRVELLYFEGCPHVSEARGAVEAAMRDSGADCTWVEWDLDAPDLPRHCEGFGSPTVLVDGVDVSGPSARAEGSACRIGGAPRSAVIAQALADRDGVPRT